MDTIYLIISLLLTLVGGMMTSRGFILFTRGKTKYGWMIIAGLILMLGAGFWAFSLLASG